MPNVYGVCLILIAVAQISKTLGWNYVRYSDCTATIKMWFTNGSCLRLKWLNCFIRKMGYRSRKIRTMHMMTECISLSFHKIRHLICSQGIVPLVCTWIVNLDFTVPWGSMVVGGLV